jgi:hypothetical protein
MILSTKNKNKVEIKRTDPNEPNPNEPNETVDV